MTLTPPPAKFSTFLPNATMDCNLSAPQLAILLQNSAKTLALLLLKAVMNFLKMSSYWISNLKQSWTDLWGIVSYIPAITIMASAVIFVWSLKILMINSSHTSVREYVFKSLISGYAVACCWGIFFAVCAIFVSPIQIYNQRTVTVPSLVKPTADRRLKSDLADSQVQNRAQKDR